LVLSGAAYRSKLALESLQKRPIQSEIPSIVSMQVERIKNKIAANEKLSVAEAAQAVGQSVGSDG
jgi:pyridoxine/pyridoxamine 5'-phosphate oxidase